MQGLVNYQAIFERAFASTLQKVKGKDGGIDWDDYADMYKDDTHGDGFYAKFTLKFTYHKR